MNTLLDNDHECKVDESGDPWSTARTEAQKGNNDIACRCLSFYVNKFYADPDILNETWVLVLIVLSLVCELIAVYFIS